MRKKYMYRGELYDDEYSLEEAICEYIGGNYNNIDPSDTAEYEDEFYSEVEEVEVDE